MAILWFHCHQFELDVPVSRVPLQFGCHVSLWSILTSYMTAYQRQLVQNSSIPKCYLRICRRIKIDKNHSEDSHFFSVFEQIVKYVDRNNSKSKVIYQDRQHSLLWFPCHHPSSINNMNICPWNQNASHQMLDNADHQSLRSVRHMSDLNISIHFFHICTCYSLFWFHSLTWRLFRVKYTGNLRFECTVHRVELFHPGRNILRCNFQPVCHFQQHFRKTFHTSDHMPYKFDHFHRKWLRSKYFLSETPLNVRKMFDCKIKTYSIIPCFANPVWGQCLGKYILWRKQSDHYKRIHCDFHSYNSNSPKCMLPESPLFSMSGQMEKQSKSEQTKYIIFLQRWIDFNLPQGNHWICHCLTICCTFPLQQIWFHQCKAVLVLHHYWLHYRMCFVLAKHQQTLKSSVRRGKTSFYKHPSNASKGEVFAMNLMNCSILRGKIIGWILIECAT